MNWLSVAIAIGSALGGFAAGYGALRAMVNDLRSQMTGLSLTMNTASLTLQSVMSDAKHFGQQLSDQHVTLRDLADRLRQVELDLARLNTH